MQGNCLVYLLKQNITNQFLFLLPSVNLIFVSSLIEIYATNALVTIYFLNLIITLVTVTKSKN